MIESSIVAVSLALPTSAETRSTVTEAGATVRSHGVRVATSPAIASPLGPAMLLHVRCMRSSQDVVQSKGPAGPLVIDATTPIAERAHWFVSLQDLPLMPFLRGEDLILVEGHRDRGLRTRES